MATLKYPIAECVENVGTPTTEDVSLKGGTKLDQKDMYRLGKFQSLQVKLSGFRGESNTNIPF